MSAQREPYDAPAIRAFGITLGKMRNTAGLAKTQLAETLGYSPQLLGQIESARNIPSMAFAQDLDTFFKFDGLFLELWKLIRATRRLGLAAGFAKYAELERSAITVRMFETRLIPDLLQTEEYARAIAAPRTRTEREAVLDRENPPHVFLVIDEEALRRKVGSPEIARAQLAHLLELARRPEISLQVLARDTDCAAAYTGSFTVLGFEDDGEVVYIESAGQGSLIDRPSAVASCAMRFDLLRGHAYSITESRSILEKALKTLEA